MDFVISEDSDLLVFGCKKCFYKMDRTFTGEEFDRSRMNVYSDIPLENISQEKFI